MAKLTRHFTDFLRDTVNLNQTRIDDLESNVGALKRFLRQCEWEPKIRGFSEQGSWAHQTIIKPVDGAEFDADLLVLVDHVDGWTAADYVRSLGKAFAESPTYAEKAKVWDYCVTITYAGERKVDLAPCVVGRLWKNSLEVCNRTRNEFQRTEPVGYTTWLREKNALSGSNSFRKVTRLFKYLRDIKRTFTCSSVLLTTLLGSRIQWYDKDAAGFADVPTTLKTVIGRLDDWLQARPTRPTVPNPMLPEEDFAANWTDTQYSNFRVFVHKYRGWIDEAYETEGRDESIRAWRKIFGDQFAKGQLVESSNGINSTKTTMGSLLATTAHHSGELVDFVARVGVAALPSWFFKPPHMQSPPWPRLETVSNNAVVHATWHPSRQSPSSQAINQDDTLPRNGGIWFDLTINGGRELPEGYRVQWRVTNTGVMAMALNAGRGGFYAPTSGNRRWEELSYRGVHIVEAFILRRSDDVLVAKSPPFSVIIE